MKYIDEYSLNVIAERWAEECKDSKQQRLENLLHACRGNHGRKYYGWANMQILKNKSRALSDGGFDDPELAYSEAVFEFFETYTEGMGLLTLSPDEQIDGNTKICRDALKKWCEHKDIEMPLFWQKRLCSNGDIDARVKANIHRPWTKAKLCNYVSRIFRIPMNPRSGQFAKSWKKYASPEMRKPGRPRKNDLSN